MTDVVGEGSVTAGGRRWFAATIVFAAVAVGVAPVVFGLCAMWCATRCRRLGHRLGKLALVIASTATCVGMVLNAIVVWRG